MNTSRMPIVLGVALMLISTTALAEPLDVKLGLWETTTIIATTGMPVPPQVLNSMSPEQRARMEAVMKKRQLDGPKSRTHQSCLTKGKLDRPFANDEDEKNCTRTAVTDTRTRKEYRLECKGPEPRTGEARFEAVSPERVRGDFKMNTGNGVVTMEMTGKWIAADCRGVN
jgi:hypothetical protein